MEGFRPILQTRQGQVVGQFEEKWGLASWYPGMRRKKGSLDQIIDDLQAAEEEGAENAVVNE